MGKQMTEMLKGTLEGIVLAHLAVQPAYGYEIIAERIEQLYHIEHQREEGEK
jgi:PadR family transcriptional regulator PadR